MSKHSFPPRLTENETRHLEGRYADDATITHLLNRGLLQVVWTGYDAKTRKDTTEIAITRRGELMLTRYRSLRKAA